MLAEVSETTELVQSEREVEDPTGFDTAGLRYFHCGSGVRVAWGTSF
jgi:hypothetical protein